MKKIGCFLTGAFKALLTLILILMLCLSVVTLAGSRLLTDRNMHETIATEDKTIDLQMAAIQDGIKALTSKYSFEPNSFSDLIDSEMLRKQNLNVVAWWMSALESKENLDVPTWSAPDLKTILAEDEIWNAETKSAKKSADKLTKAINSLVNGTVLPVRTQIISLGLGAVWKKVNLAQLTAWLPYLPVILLLTSTALMGILLCLRNGLSYVGAAMITSFVLHVCMLFVGWKLQLVTLIRAASPVLALQLEAAIKTLSVPVLICMGIELILGLVFTYRGAYVRKEIV